MQPVKKNKINNNIQHWEKHLYVKDIIAPGVVITATKFIYNNSDLVTVTQRKFASRVAPYCNPNNTLAIVKNSIDYNLPCWNMERVPKPNRRSLDCGGPFVINSFFETKNSSPSGT